MSRAFLFLQGNSSHFFRALGQALGDRGYRVRRINVCGGDRFFWGDWNAVDYSGAPDDFADFAQDLIASEGISDIIMHNDCRPLHRAVIDAVAGMGCHAWVFEEGYIRPHWLTLEEGGINGYSPLLRDPLLLSDGDDGGVTEEPDFVSLEPAMRRRVIYDFQWQIWNYLNWLRYPRYRTHRPFPIWAEYATWVRRLVTLPLRSRQARRIVDRLVIDRDPYFVFPMQLDSDSQVRMHSSHIDMTSALEYVIGSFASNTPAPCRLVVKAHPLDNGWTNFRRRVHKLAGRFGVSDRIDYIDGGDLEALIDSARGVVTLNSTVGLTALGLGCPVICLGRAIFDRPGLTFQGELDEFWASATAPDMGLFADFRRKLLVRSMINGDYYTPGGIRLAVANAIARFEAVGQGRADTVADGAAGVAVRERQSRTGVADRVPAPADTPQTIVAAVRH
ncbi:capsular biosynthesis protein [uncultured Parvibaculum sp.]|uniref:capsule biosynthesis protein n=1 Tax=uncultured Parvibaculum sp. TaxID=291828 RepID=UPI0030D8E624|tara:strand:+ start:25424 stop:26764 length:1341 start_codon:yes stop_codon:yes gene_type:complete